MLFISPCATSHLLRRERLSPNALFFCANSDDEARVKSLFDLIPEKHLGFPMIITETNEDRTRKPFGEQQAHLLRRRLEEMGHPHIWCSFPRQRPDALFDKTSATLDGLKTTKPSSYVLLGRTVDTASILAHIRRREKFTPVLMVSPSLELLAQQPDYKKWSNLFVVLDDARLVEDTSTKMREFRDELRARRIDFHEYAYFAHDAAVIFVSAFRATAHITDIGDRRRALFEQLVGTHPDPMQNERLVLTQSAAGNTMQLTHVARRLSRGTWVQGLEVEPPGLAQRFMEFNKTPFVQMVLVISALASIVGVGLAVATLPSCHPGSAVPSIQPRVDGK
jgi:broad specificity phosphatase PhoE